MSLTLYCADGEHTVKVRSAAPAGERFWDWGGIGQLRDEGLNLTGIDWLIVGGESGPYYRPIREEWVRDLRDACHVDDPEGCYCTEDDYFEPPEGRFGQCHTAFFFKQWGGRTPKAGGRELDGRTWDEFPSPASTTDPQPERKAHA